MEKINNKILCLLLILLIPFIVHAEECNDSNVSVESIMVEGRESGVFEIEGVNVNSNTAKFDLNMNKVGDSAQYKITIKNNGNKNFEINSKKISTTSKYLEYSIESDENSIVVPSKSSKDIHLKVEYKNQIPDSEFSSGTYNDEQIITLKAIDNNGIINPKTGGIIITIICILLLVISILSLFIFKKKAVKQHIFIMGLLLLLPIGVYAVCQREIKLEALVKFNKSLIETVEQETEGQLSPGDEIAVRGEHFYVVSSNENETVLLTKYNLYVGDVFLESKYNGSINQNEVGYGYQATEVTNVHVISVGKDIGIVPFSSKPYWLDENNNIKEQYGSSPWNPMINVDIYDNTFNKTRFEFDKATLNEEGKCLHGLCRSVESDYSIAYFVDNYVKLLKDMGLLVREGRLLTDTEASALGCDTGNPNTARCPKKLNWLNQGIYWLGSLYNKNSPRMIERGQMFFAQYNDITAGVRPVVVIDTELIPLKNHEYFVNKPHIDH